MALDLNKFKNKKFGRLTVLGVETVEIAGKLRSRFICSCECGNYKNLDSFRIRIGKTKSCGCLNSELASKRRATHRSSKSRAYAVWSGMKERCQNPKNRSYPNYGGRGIVVCHDWEKFEGFLADMGHPPKDLTLERLDNNLGYSKENCIWASRDVQAKNRRSNIVLTYMGRSLLASEWARRLNLKLPTILARYHKGKPIEQILNQKLSSGRKL